MRTGFAILSIAAILAGCSKADEGLPTDWPSLHLQGKTLDLVDDAKVETYSFNDQGLVSVTIGTRGGPVAAPLYYWKLKGNVLVISEFPDQPGAEELSSPKVQGDLVSASRTSGTRVQFRLSKANG